MKPMVCETPRERTREEKTAAPTEIAHARSQKKKGTRRETKRKRDRDGTRRDGLFAGIVINGLGGFRRAATSGFADRTSPSIARVSFPPWTEAVRPSLFDNASVFGTWDVPLLGSPAPQRWRIYFVYLFIDLFGMISPVITGRLQDIICMIMARANVPDGGLHLSGLIMSKESAV
ncbi:hypothetical protein K0M31_018352 [Melipona bicolor]|uniref:Uncharacterized protein n=1 Tax=Melipona bicolor TaxID=60889 RepID=A0AA40G3A5_9HYME|nr:hypothetical protein K0M31_018352 [Melipona bicolor]